MSETYQFYGAPISYFSGKLRFYLQFKRIPYINHMADAKAYEQVIMPRTGLPFIPVLVSPEGETLQDTVDIIDNLEERHPQRPILPRDPALMLVARLVELWVDEFLLYPGLFMRWGLEEQLDWVYDEFGRMFLHHQPGDKRQVGETQASRITRYMPKLGFDDPAVGEACRTVFDRLLSRFEAVLNKRDYLLGDTPSIMDIYLMAPIYAHWMQDPVPAALIRKNYHAVCMWADRMVSANALPSDEQWAIDDLALAFLKEMGACFGHMMTRGAQLMDGLLGSLSEGEALPRGGPDLDSFILETPVKRRVNPYWSYKYQKVWDARQLLEDPDSLTAMLEEMGCLDLVQHEPVRCVGKVNGRLVVLN